MRLPLLVRQPAFQKHKNTSSAAAIRDAIDFLIKSHKGPISAREVMWGGVKPIPSHFCVLWGFNRSVLISCYQGRSETLTLNSVISAFLIRCHNPIPPGHVTFSSRRPSQHDREKFISRAPLNHAGKLNCFACGGVEGLRNGDSQYLL